ncbi:Nuclear transport factor 2 [Coelomomyces lativittatus]|nr:Nuclear transport factor 2 [Coelomomyces lativittatus]
MLTFEGERFQGVVNIMSKFQQLPFNSVEHSFSSIDCQPSCVPNGVIVLVTGHLRIDVDNPFLPFSETFHFFVENGKFWIQHHLFRFGLA